MHETCAVCCHLSRPDIEIALADGEPLGDLARRFEASAKELRDHRGHHHWWQTVSDELRKLLQANGALLSEIQVLLMATCDLTVSESPGDPRSPTPAAPATLPDPGKVFAELQRWQERFERLNATVDSMGGWAGYWAVLEEATGAGAPRARA